MSRVVHVTAPSRLHFGLWSLGGGEGRQFGGVGAMIEQPQLRLSIKPAEQLEAAGENVERVIAFPRRWAAFQGMSEPACQIEIQAVIPEHAGLGSGTQLALSVAAG